MGNVRNPLTGKFHPKPPKDQHKGCKTCGAPLGKAFSLYCWKHKATHARTRSPNGRMPTRAELKPFRSIIEVAMMIGVEQEPEAAKAFQFFHDLIRIHTSDRIMQAQFNRLLQDGATGREMAVRVMTVVALQVETFGGRPDLGKGELTPDNLRAAMGNQVLRATAPPRRGRTPGKRSQEIPLPGRVCFQIGDVIVDRNVFGHLHRLWKRCLYRYEEARGDHLCKLFEPMPADPSQPRELRHTVAMAVRTPTPGKRHRPRSPAVAPAATPTAPYTNPAPVGHDAYGLPTFE